MVKANAYRTYVLEHDGLVYIGTSRRPYYRLLQHMRAWKVGHPTTSTKVIQAAMEDQTLANFEIINDSIKKIDHCRACACTLELFTIRQWAEDYEVVNWGHPYDHTRHWSEDIPRPECYAFSHQPRVMPPLP